MKYGLMNENVYILKLSFILMFITLCSDFTLYCVITLFKLTLITKSNHNKNEVQKTEHTDLTKAIYFDYEHQ